jgi:polysaccharide export outer membrane protein
MRSFKINFSTPLVILIVILLGTSCSTPLNKIIYLNGIETNTTHKSEPIPDEYKIKPNDQLYIKVISDDPMNAAFLNLSNTTTNISNTGSLELITYLVDNEGFITYPKLGKIHVVNKTAEEVQNIIQEKVDKYLKSASVFVKLVNRNITLLGEVNSPGQKTMAKNQLTIFEALGTAGDLTDYGNRENVKLIRELPEGRYIAELDLTDPELIHSPYYYVLPQDIIYVEHRTRIYGAKNMPFTAPLSITSSTISLILLIMNLVDNK